MSNYDYPPSEHIRRYEPFEPNSHFYVRGDCLYEGKKYPCEFEIAYALKGQIYIVCYISEHYHELFSIPLHDPPMTGLKMYVPKNTNIQVGFSGKELRNYNIIDIEQATSIRRGGFLEDKPPVFVANSYSLKVTDAWTLRANPPRDTTFEIINVPGNSTFAETVIFNINKSSNLTLSMASLPTEGATTKENSILSVPHNSIPIGWRADDVAGLWCSCVSIATGLDIRWIVKNTYNKRAITQTFVYRRNIIRNLSTYGVIRNNSAFWDDSAVHQFINTVFACGFNRSLSLKAVRDYSRLMWHFVEYRLITNRAEDQARLISTTVEELLTLWEKHTGNVAKGTISAVDAEVLWDELDRTLLKNLKTLLPTSNSDLRSDAKRRFKRFLTRDMVDASFEQGLRNLFKLTKNDQEWFKNNVESRLEDFVETRNKIAHEGRFPSQDSSDLFEYFYDMLMILPLMIFSIFGYTGSYFDLAQEYRRINTNRLADQTSDETE